ncbi:MAG: ABC transporter permease subunit, partial [Clostridiales bacterium]|nr:ABC transporter permease subunit [Clostridiales bacterium]
MSAMQAAATERSEAMAPAIGAALNKKPRRPLSAVIKKYWFFYLLVLPGFLMLLLFNYVPMYGLIVGFKDWNIVKGILGSPWTDNYGFKYFISFLTDAYFWRVIKNTLLINLYNLLFGFTFTIFLALMINEVRARWFKRAVQTAVYLPYFLSWIIFAGLISAFLDPQTGLINNLIVLAGGTPIRFLTDNRYFQFILVLTNTIKESGYDSILYLAAIAGINPELYESAKVDGGNRLHMIRHITLPHITPTIAVLLLLRVSRLLGSNFDQIYNLYSPMVFDTGDTAATYIYRIGLEQSMYSLSTAVNLFTNILGLLLLLGANK